MKKILAILLSLVMLLSAFAFAEEAAPAAHSYALSGIYLASGDQLIDLSGIKLELDVSGDDEAPAVRLHMDSDDGSSVELGFTKVDGIYVMHMDSPSLGHRDFGIDPVVYVERQLRDGIDALIGLLQSVDTHGAAETLVSFFDSLGEQPADAPEAEPTEEPAEAPAEMPDGQMIEIDLSDISIEGDIVAAIMSCFSEPQTTYMGGQIYGLGGSELEIPDGEYSETTFSIDTEKLCEILDMIHSGDAPIGLGDAIRESGLQLNVSGTLRDSEAASSKEIAASLAVGDMKSEGSLDIYRFATEAGTSTTVISNTAVSGQPSASVQITCADTVHEGDAFTADSVDMANVTMLSDMEDEDALKALQEAFTALGMDAIQQVLAPIMSALMANIDMTAMQ